MLATLGRRDFAFIWCAGLISLVGDRALMTALPFYVYQQTGSTLATAVLFAAAYLPLVLLGSVAGVFVDRWDRKRIMVVTNLIQALVVALLFLAHTGSWVWLVSLVAFAEMSLAMFFQPAERALLPSLVEADQLVPANALTGLNDNIARLAGPPIGGALLGFFGLGSVAIVDSISFLIAAALISFVSAPSAASRESDEQDEATRLAMSAWAQVWCDWLDGLRLVRRDRLIATLFIVLGVTSLGGTIIDPLYAPFVGSVLHGGAATLGWLSTVSALGGLLAGVLVGRFGRTVHPRHLTSVGTAATGALMLAMYHQTTLTVVFVLGFLLNVPVVCAGVGSTTLLQAGVQDRYRGRVYGAFNTTNGLISLASVGLAGFLGHTFGIVPALSLAGGITIIAGLLALVLLPKAGGESTQESDPKVARA